MAKRTRIRTPSLTLIFAYVAVWIGSHPCRAQQVVLEDDFDSGIHDWVYEVEKGAKMTWDAAEGNPTPGSLLLSTVNPPTQVNAFRAVGPCMETVPYETWYAEAKVKKTGSRFGRCEPYISVFRTPDCTGQGTTFGWSGNTPLMEPDVWHSRDGGFLAYPVTPSARPVLLMSVPPGIEITCHFDSVVISNNRGATPLTDIPTLSAATMLVMAMVLATLGVALLLRRRRKMAE